MTLKLAVFVLGLVGLPAIIWLVLPVVARRDRILFASFIFAAGFALAGVVGLVLQEPRGLTQLSLGLVGSLYVRTRWRAATAARSPHRDA